MFPVRSLVAALAVGSLALFTGPALLPGADAQAPAKAPAAPPKADPDVEIEIEFAAPPTPAAAPKPPAPRAVRAGVTRSLNYSYSTTNRTPWEYEYADVPKELAAFKALLADKGKAGWEYAGTAKGDSPVAGQGGPAGVRTAEVAVFKRPATRGSVTTFTAPVPPSVFGAGGPAPAFVPAPPSVSVPRPDVAAEVEQAKAAYEVAKAAFERAEAKAKSATQARTSRMVALKNAAAAEVAEVINGVFNKKGASPARLRAIAEPRGNTVYIEGTAVDTKAAEAIIRALDQAPEAESKKP